MTFLLGFLTIQTMDELKRSFDRMQEQIIQIVDIFNNHHKKGHDFGTGDLLYPAEIHTIQAIGDKERVNVKALAKTLNVTAATISERIKKLKRLELVSAGKSDENLKEIVLKLTERGWIAYQGHNDHHRDMYLHFKNFFGRGSADQIRKCQQAFAAYLDVLKNQKPDG